MGSRHKKSKNQKYKKKKEKNCLTRAYSDNRLKHYLAINIKKRDDGVLDFFYHISIPIMKKIKIFLIHFDVAKLSDIMVEWVVNYFGAPDLSLALWRLTDMLKRIQAYSDIVDQGLEYIISLFEIVYFSRNIFRTNMDEVD